MSNDNLSTPFPNIPRGSGLTKRFLWAILLGLASIIILFLYFMHHYTPKPITLQQKAEPINSLEAENLIHEAQSQKISAPQIKSQQYTPKKQISQTFLSEAAQSAISSSSTEHLSQPLSHLNSTNTPASHPELGLKLPETYTQNEYKQQNQQGEKQAFLKNSKVSQATKIKGDFILPASPYTLTAGTLIPATLQTGIQSDLPGTIIAKVRRDVFDSATGNYLLIPQGTTLIGIYDSQVSYGQSRVLIAWQRLIFPNGTSQKLAGQAGVDLMGLAGLHDHSDNHYVRLFSSALMFSLFGTASQLTQAPTGKGKSNPMQLLGGSLAQQLSQVGAKLVERNMNIQPTINIRPGDIFNVLLSRDLVLPIPYQFP